MKTVVLILTLVNLRGMGGGVEIQTVPFDNMRLCNNAKTLWLQDVPKWGDAKAICVNTGDKWPDKQSSNFYPE